VSFQLALLAPIAVGVIAAALFWLGHRLKRDVGPKAREKACKNCGSAVFDDWRLCPDCGRLIESPVEKVEISPTSN